MSEEKGCFGRCLSFTFKSFDTIVFWLDPIFATALVAQGVLLILFANPENWNITDFILVSYYFFFALLIYFSMLGKKLVHKYLGFMNGTFAKGLFFIFLGTLSLGTWRLWGWSLFFAVGLGAVAVLNMMRFCTKKKCTEEEQEEEHHQSLNMF